MSIPSISTSLPPSSGPEVSAVLREAKPAAPPVQSKAIAASQSAQPVSHEQLKAAIKSVQEYIEPINNALEFSMNDDTNQMVVKIIDRDTKEVIRQMPSEEMIAIAKALDSIKGLFVKQNA